MALQGYSCLRAVFFDALHDGCGNFFPCEPFGFFQRVFGVCAVDFGIAADFSDQGRQFGRIVAGDKLAVLTGVDDLRHGADAASDAGQTVGHGFGEGDAEAVEA